MKIPFIGGKHKNINITVEPTTLTIIQFASEKWFIFSNHTAGCADKQKCFGVFVCVIFIHAGHVIPLPLVLVIQLGFQVSSLQWPKEKTQTS